MEIAEENGAESEEEPRKENGSAEVEEKRIKEKKKKEKLEKRLKKKRVVMIEEDETNGMVSENEVNVVDQLVKQNGFGYGLGGEWMLDVGCGAVRGLRD